MDYFVIGEDGTEYGPATIATLQQWVTEGRVHRTTQLKGFQDSIVVSAGSLGALYPEAARPAAPVPPQVTVATPGAPGQGNPYAQPPSPYPRTPTAGKPVVYNDGTADVWWALGRSVLAVGLAVAPFTSPMAGLFVGGYGVWRGVRADQSGHQFGRVALIVSIVAMVIVVGVDAFKFTDRMDRIRSYQHTGSSDPGFRASEPDGTTPQN